MTALRTEVCPACGARVEIVDGKWANHSKRFVRKPGKQFMCVLAFRPYEEPDVEATQAAVQRLFERNKPKPLMGRQS